MARHPLQLVLGATFLVAIGQQPLVGQSGTTMPIADEFERLHFRSIGPATMSGRVSDIAVYEPNTAIYYVAAAHGGVWKTTSNGTMFTPLFQDQGLMSVGDVTVSQTNPDLVWMGSGESNNRQSTSWGDGVYKSTDGGKTWTNTGLRESKHIGRIVIDPNNNDVVLVAATGPLFGSGGERGVYKTTDGGRTWKQVLKIDDETGANDIVMAVTDPKILYATTYQRRRTACCVNGGGPGSGIWKSIDGGDSWTRLSGGGLPSGPLGRIGIDVYRKNASIVYASIEGPNVGGGRGGGGGGGGGAAGGAGRGGAAAGVSGLYRSDDGGQTWRRANATNPRPLYFSQVRVDPNNADHVYMGGVGLHMTIDAGKTIETDAAMAIHDDVHAIWIDPANSNHLLIGDDGGVAVSYDKSKTWQFIPNIPVGLFYHVGYDMEMPYNICGGMQDNYDWCGPSASRHSAGIFNYDWFQIQGGDGFVAIPDPRDSRWVYSETQDGNLIRRNKVTGESRSIRPAATNVTPVPAPNESFRWHWDTPMIISPNDPGTLLVAANRVFKSTDRGDSWTAISPDLTTNARRDTIVTMGLKGSDITLSRDDGVSQWPAIVALAESAKQPGLYYTGTDDGVLSISRDGGKTWQNITSRLAGFPAGGFVSEVVPSRYDAGTVYVTVDNHRLNDYAPYIWVSNDFGVTFHSLVSNLKGENVRTLTEDQKNPDVLYIGTETGIFLSLDRGRSWRRLKANLPTVRVDEITLHPRDNAMLVATHGRALWVLDHLEPIQEYAATQAASGDAKLFSIPTTLEWKSKDDRNEEFWGHQFFVGENPPVDAVIHFYVKKPASDLKVRISDASGRTLREVAVPADRKQPGIQAVCWDMRVEPIAGAEAAGGRGGGGGGGGGGRGGTPAVPGVPMPLPSAGYLPASPCGGAPATAPGGGGGFGGGGGAAAGPYVRPGTYTVALTSGGTTIDSKPLRIVMDAEVRLADAQRKRLDDAVLDLHDIQRRGTATANALNALYPQMTSTATKLKDNGAVPASVKSDFEALKTQFDSVRVKFGVPLVAGGGRGFGGGAAGGPPIDTSTMSRAQIDSVRQALQAQGGGGAGGAGGGGGGGGGGGRGGDPRNALARVSSMKASLMGVWEPLSAASTKQSADAKAVLMRAITDANAVLARASAMSQTLKKYDVTLTVAAPSSP